MSKIIGIHLNKAQERCGNVSWMIKMIDRIMELSERHPYYVNYPCDEVWSRDKHIPTIKDVDSAWDMVVEEERSALL